MTRLIAPSWLHRIGYVATIIVVAQISIAVWYLGKSYFRQREIIRAAATDFEATTKISREKYRNSGRYFPLAYRKPTIICNLGIRSQPVAIVGDIENKWYSDQLSAAQEPSLYFRSQRRPSGSGTVVRFTWLRTFDPAVFVRVEGLGTTTPHIQAKELSGAGGYEPGFISRRIDRPLTSIEAKSLISALDQKGVLRLAPKECDMGFDGAQWVIESVDQRGYHFVDRWSPERGEVREIGLFMLGLTGWSYTEIY